jgi:hypothetical protein
MNGKIKVWGKCTVYTVTVIKSAILRRATFHMHMQLLKGWKKYRTTGPLVSENFFEFPENISPRKKNCNNSDKRRKSEENSHHDLRSAIISATILIVR